MEAKKRRVQFSVALIPIACFTTLPYGNVESYILLHKDIFMKIVKFEHEISVKSLKAC